MSITARVITLIVHMEVEWLSGFKNIELKWQLFGVLVRHDGLRSALCSCQQ
jgi:hypothetical protein